MFIKFLFNIFINIAIFVLVLTLFWAFNHEYYSIAAATIVSLAMFIYLKVRVIKSVRELARKGKG